MSTDYLDQLTDLMRRIETSDVRARHRFQPQLRALLEEMEESDHAVPAHVRDLHQDLVCEAIEAQFDNMPV